MALSERPPRGPLGKADDTLGINSWPPAATTKSRGILIEDLSCGVTRRTNNDDAIEDDTVGAVTRRLVLGR